MSKQKRQIALISLRTIFKKVNAVEIKQEVHNDRYALVITEIGPSFEQVFAEVRQMTGKSLKEVAELLKQARPAVVTATKRELIVRSASLTKAGAKIEFEIIS